MNRTYRENDGALTATDAVAKVEQTAPRGRAGAGMSPQQTRQKVNEVLEELQIDPEAEPDKAKQVRGTIARLPISIVDSTWPGRELFDITHLNGGAIFKLNHGHPFIREICSAMVQLPPQRALSDCRSAPRPSNGAGSPGREARGRSRPSDAHERQACGEDEPSSIP